MLRHLACAIAACTCAAPTASAETFSVGAKTTIVGEMHVVTVHAGETLMDLARRFDLGYEELVAANPSVDPWLPTEGAQVELPTRYILPNVPRVGIVVNVAAMRLFYFPPASTERDSIVMTYPIAIGREHWPTPVGTTTVIAKERDPVWQVPPSILDEHALDGHPLPAVVEPGPTNPLGHYALRLGFEGYLIHGTNKHFGIGMQLTHGCIRLYPADIQALFARVTLGTPVRIIDEHDLAAWDHGVLYFEAHPRTRASGEDRMAAIEAVRDAPGESQPFTTADWDSVFEVVSHPSGIPRPVMKPIAVLTGARDRADKPPVRRAVP